MGTSSPKASDTTRSLLLAGVWVVVFSALAFVAVHLLQDAMYGATVFVVVPLLAGFIAGLRTPTLKAALFAIAFGFGLGLVTLLYSGLEGLVCVLMALPLIAGLAFLGAWSGRLLGPLVKRKLSSGHGGKGSALALLLGLLLVGCSAILEGSYEGDPPMHTVVSTRTFPVSEGEAWAALLSFQQITGEKPWLLKMGLPVPQYCTIEGSGVGAMRRCHFDQGVIEERISVWRPPRRLVMEITNVTLPGRDWLKFIDASYELTGTRVGETTVVRTTRIASVLRPRLYWQPLEELATQAEHEYLFNAVASKLTLRDPGPSP